MQDLTFKQAMDTLAQTFTEQVCREVQKRLDFLQDGQTIAEVTADISDLRLRKTVTDSLLFVYSLSLGTSLCRLGIINQNQADELQLYLRGQLAYPLPNVLSLLAFS